MLLNLLDDMFFAAIPAVGFAILFNVPRNALKYCAYLGALGHGVETRAGSTHGPAPVMNHGTHTGGVRCGVVYASHREHIRPPGGTPVARARRLHGSLLSQPRLEV